ILKGLCAENGPISCEDANRNKYTAQFVQQDRKSFPLATSFRAINMYLERHPGDRAFVEKLTIGGLSSPLKAKMRKELADQMAPIARVSTITKFTVGAADEEEGEE